MGKNGRWIGAVLGAIVGASGGAGTALVGGQLGPQVATPEEVITVPGGGLVGAIVGAYCGYKMGEKL